MALGSATAAPTTGTGTSRNVEFRLGISNLPGAREDLKQFGAEILEVQRQLDQLHNAAKMMHGAPIMAGRNPVGGTGELSPATPLDQEKRGSGALDEPQTGIPKVPPYPQPIPGFQQPAQLPTSSEYEAGLRAGADQERSRQPMRGATTHAGIGGPGIDWDSQRRDMEALERQHGQMTAAVIHNNGLMADSYQRINAAISVALAGVAQLNERRTPIGDVETPSQETNRQSRERKSPTVRRGETPEQRREEALEQGLEPGTAEFVSYVQGPQQLRDVDKRRKKREQEAQSYQNILDREASKLEPLIPDDPFSDDVLAGGFQFGPPVPAEKPEQPPVQRRSTRETAASRCQREASEAESLEREREVEDYHRDIEHRAAEWQRRKDHDARRRDSARELESLLESMLGRDRRDAEVEALLGESLSRKSPEHRPMPRPAPTHATTPDAEPLPEPRIEPAPALQDSKPIAEPRQIPNLAPTVAPARIRDELPEPIPTRRPVPATEREPAPLGATDEPAPRPRPAVVAQPELATIPHPAPTHATAPEVEQPIVRQSESATNRAVQSPRSSDLPGPRMEPAPEVVPSGALPIAREIPQPAPTHATATAPEVPQPSPSPRPGPAPILQNSPIREELPEPEQHTESATGSRQSEPMPEPRTIPRPAPTHATAPAREEARPVESAPHPLPTSQSLPAPAIESTIQQDAIEPAPEPRAAERRTNQLPVPAPIREQLPEPDFESQPRQRTTPKPATTHVAEPADGLGGAGAEHVEAPQFAMPPVPKGYSGVHRVGGEDVKVSVSQSGEMRVAYEGDSENYIVPQSSGLYHSVAYDLEERRQAQKPPRPESAPAARLSPTREELAEPEPRPEQKTGRIPRPAPTHASVREESPEPRIEPAPALRDSEQSEELRPTPSPSPTRAPARTREALPEPILTRRPTATRELEPAPIDMPEEPQPAPRSRRNRTEQPEPAPIPRPAPTHAANPVADFPAEAVGPSAPEPRPAEPARRPINRPAPTHATAPEAEHQSNWQAEPSPVQRQSRRQAPSQSPTHATEQPTASPLSNAQLERQIQQIESYERQHLQMSLSVQHANRLIAGSYLQIGQSVMSSVAGIVQLGLSGSESAEKILRGFMAVQGAVNTVHGVIETTRTFAMPGYYRQRRELEQNMLQYFEGRIERLRGGVSGAQSLPGAAEGLAGAVGHHGAAGVGHAVSDVAGAATAAEAARKAIRPGRAAAEAAQTAGGVASWSQLGHGTRGATHAPDPEVEGLLRGVAGPDREVDELLHGVVPAAGAAGARAAGGGAVAAGGAGAAGGAAAGGAALGGAAAAALVGVGAAIVSAIQTTGDAMKFGLGGGSRRNTWRDAIGDAAAKSLAELAFWADKLTGSVKNAEGTFLQLSRSMEQTADFQNKFEDRIGQQRATAARERQYMAAEGDLQSFRRGQQERGYGEQMSFARPFEDFQSRETEVELMGTSMERRRQELAGSGMSAQQRAEAERQLAFQGVRQEREQRRLEIDKSKGGKFGSEILVAQLGALEANQPGLRERAQRAAISGGEFEAKKPVVNGEGGGLASARGLTPEAMRGRLADIKREEEAIAAEERQYADWEKFHSVGGHAFDKPSEHAKPLQRSPEGSLRRRLGAWMRGDEMRDSVDAAQNDRVKEQKTKDAEEDNIWQGKRTLPARKAGLETERQVFEKALAASDQQAQPARQAELENLEKISQMRQQIARMSMEELTSQIEGGERRIQQLDKEVQAVMQIREHRAAERGSREEAFGGADMKAQAQVLGISRRVGQASKEHVLGRFEDIEQLAIDKKINAGTATAAEEKRWTDLAERSLSNKRDRDWLKEYDKRKQSGEEVSPEDEQRAVKVRVEQRAIGMSYETKPRQQLIGQYGSDLDKEALRIARREEAKFRGADEAFGESNAYDEDRNRLLDRQESKARKDLTGTESATEEAMRQRDAQRVAAGEKAQQDRFGPGGIEKTGAEYRENAMKALDVRMDWKAEPKFELSTEAAAQKIVESIAPRILEYMKNLDADLKKRVENLEFINQTRGAEGR